MRSILILLFATPPAFAQCDRSLQAHVYNPGRLMATGKGCVTATGIIVKKQVEADGDLHIQLRLDPGQSPLINKRNQLKQNNSGAVKQLDATAACLDYKSRLKIPGIGAHVRVVGMHVLDTSPNHGWLEIHPVTQIYYLPFRKEIKNVHV